MHIGLIGGIGPAATDFYYRRLITAFAARKASLDLTIVHADTPTLLAHLGANNVKAQVAIYERVTNRLAAAGAECVVVTSIAGHFCIDAFKPVSALKVIDMLEEVRSIIAAEGLRRIGILGTRTVMETRFYGGITTAEIMPPEGQALDDVHQAYIAMAASGSITEAQRATFISAGKHLIKAGAEAVMLGGTDLALAFPGGIAPFPLVDCAAIHVDAIVSAAIPLHSPHAPGRT